MVFIFRNIEHMKKLTLITSLFLLFTSVSAFSDCNFKKAARNEVLDSKIGISGRCDTQKAVKTKATNQVNDTLGIDAKKIKNDAVDTKDNIEGKVSTAKKVADVVR